MKKMILAALPVLLTTQVHAENLIGDSFICSAESQQLSITYYNKYIITQNLTINSGSNASFGAYSKYDVIKYVDTNEFINKSFKALAKNDVNTTTEITMTHTPFSYQLIIDLYEMGNEKDYEFDCELNKAMNIENLDPALLGLM